MLLGSGVVAQAAGTAGQAASNARAVAAPQLALQADTSALAQNPSPLVRVADGRLLAPDIARIVNRGELVVAMLKTDNPPFFSEKNGELNGTDVDLARLIGKELGVPVRFDRSPETYDGVAETVAAGQADLGISRLARTLKRGQIVHFSSTYMRLGHALLINRVRFAEIAGGSSVPQVLRNFKGKISVIGSSSWEEFGRRNFPNATLVVYPTWGDAVAAVKKGEVVAAYRDELEVMAILRRDPSLALTLRTVTFNDLESSLSMMVGVRDATLLSFVNELIAQRPEKPTVASVLKMMN
ncbi:transporter substrate-binding domain-containing protein [Noviherbaspirillum sp. 17J57-3]|uniref:Transporter substrate-binding domain-containing protein n=2 Tax=Noviherbaspirillum galbum TaxID=2709383 RepID=A0A6B3SYF7_9BURK|nr:transporter substrate-binding domain-containing protein [Noviherbaspirillum galbum]